VAGRSKYKDMDDCDDEATLESARRELDIPTSLEDITLDHIVLACCSNIKSGMQEFEEMTGLKPGIVTTKRWGAGVQSSLVNWSDNVFIKIIGPIPGTSEGMLADLQAIAPGKLVAYHYSVRIDDPEKFEENSPASWEVDKVTMIGATSPYRYDEDGVFSNGTSSTCTDMGWETLCHHIRTGGKTRAIPRLTAHLEQHGGRLSNVQVWDNSATSRCMLCW
jgi:hypothetical protein